MFNEAWRLERDFYYDPAMGGLDWKAVGERYRQLVPYVAHRADLNYILGELIGELSTSHTYVSGGEYPNVPQDHHRPARRGLVAGRSERALPAGEDLSRARLELRRTGTARRTRPRRARRRLPSGGQRPAGAFTAERLRGVRGHGRQADRAEAGLVGERLQAAHGDGEAGGERGVACATRRGCTPTREKVQKAHRRPRRLHPRAEHRHRRHPGIQQGLLPASRRSTASSSTSASTAAGSFPTSSSKSSCATTWTYWSNRDDDHSVRRAAAIDGPKCILANEYAGSGGDAFPYYFRRRSSGRSSASAPGAGWSGSRTTCR